MQAPSISIHLKSSIRLEMILAINQAHLRGSTENKLMLLIIAELAEHLKMSKDSSKNIFKSKKVTHLKQKNLTMSAVASSGNKIYFSS